MTVDDVTDQNDVVENADHTTNNIGDNNMSACTSRKEKRKLLKKLKRKQLRREAAIKARELEEAPETQARLLRIEQEEAERMERDRREWEERERLFVLDLEMKRRRAEEEAKVEEEKERRRREESDLVTNGDEDEVNEGDDWEYVEEGPAEIIWKGNEIIVKKKKVKVPKKAPDLQIEKQEPERPISNPLAPQSEAFNDYRSAREVLESVAQQVPNFGTEQDKAHCPFHLKTGVCRFGARCSRAHFYPDKSCTLLFKNMYSGPGLAWEQDEGLEYTDDEAELAFEEFYEDVHTEFLKFGELVNFKVCRNASSHLRGNVYVHYKFLESAMLAYQSINGRYFAGKQLSCEFVNLTKWKVAICGEYMRSRLKTCSRGSVCNFIHCFRNPGGDYEWADWNKPAPRYWQQEMGALFGYKGDGFKDENLSRSYHLRRSRSRGPGSPHRKTHSDEDYEINDHRRRFPHKHRRDYEQNGSSPRNHRTKRKRTDSVDGSDCSSEEQKSCQNSKSKRERHLKSERHVTIAFDDECREREEGDRSLKRKSGTSSWQKNDTESVHEHHRCEKSPRVERHLRNYCKHEIEDSLRKTKDRHMKDEAYLSDKNSCGSRFGDDLSPQKNRKIIDMSNDKSGYRERRRKSDSLERVEDKCHNHNNSSGATKNNSSSTLDGDRIGADRKRRHSSRRKIRSENQADIVDNESERHKERSEGRCRRSTKNRRKVKHEAESSNDGSDGGTPRRYEKTSKEDRKGSSRSKNDLDFLDVPSKCRSLYGEERHDGHGERSDRLHLEQGSAFKPPGDCETLDVKEHAEVSNDKRTSDAASRRNLSEQDKIVDGNYTSGGEPLRPYLKNSELQNPSQGRCNVESYDSQFGGLKSSRDQKCDDVDTKHMSPINESNEETTTSERAEACFRNNIPHGVDGEAKVGLEQTYRMAALKKLEEMRKHKGTPPVQSRRLNTSVEIHSHERTTVDDAEGSNNREEISASRETGTSVASERRKRI
ncbi:hypothetical protein vseg_004817 [Gypsophila vaccaria]